jgi:hypothetical protein
MGAERPRAARNKAPVAPRPKHGAKLDGRLHWSKYLAGKLSSPQILCFAGRKPFIAAVAVLSILLIIGMVILSRTTLGAYTRLDITESDTGRRIFSALLREGEEVTMNWRNSLFGLDVIEVYQARDGMLLMDQVTFADPKGLPPPEVTPADVDDLYHTGGPFTARGLCKSFSHVTYRVSEIGNPNLRIRDRTIAFKREVGFGGGVALDATRPSLIEVFNYEVLKVLGAAFSKVQG